jgi:SET domain-containing protein
MRRIYLPRGRIRPKSTRYPLRISRSRIHGFGVFALEDIPARHEVIEYTGRRLSLDQAALLKPPHDDFLIGPLEGRMINGSVEGSGAEFINHSCNSNLTWQWRQGRLFLYSGRRIREGEELTMYFTHPTKALRIPCDCGERKCRKTLRYVVEPVQHSRMKTIRSALPPIKSRYARFHLRTDYSRIHRIGVYALEDIPARRLVIEYTGKKLSWGKASQLQFPQNIYLAKLKHGYCLDGGVRGSGAQFANHSCNPNMKRRDSHGRIFLVSRRKIRVGEELTWNYHYPLNLRRVPCRCGARNCRGTFRLISE